MYEKSMGNFISLVREHLLIKQEMLAMDVNISRSMLSKIENGVESCDDETINKIFNQLQIDPQEYTYNKTWMYSQLELIYKSLIYGNDNYVSILLNIEQKEKEIYYLVFYPEYKLIQMLIAYKKGEYKKFIKLLSECSKEIVFFDNFELGLFQDFSAVKALDMNNYEESIEILNSINMTDLPDYFCGMVEFHKGKNYHFMKNFYLAARHLESATNYFVAAQNFNKIVYTQVTLSDIFFKTGNYQLAIETIEKSLDAAYSVANNEILGIINSNIAWFALVVGDYEKTIQHVQQALLYDNTKAECYFYLVFSHFRLGDTVKALHYAELAEDNCDYNKLDIHMCIAIKKIIKNSKNQISYLNELYNSIDENINPVYKQLILEFIMDYYNKIKDYENLAKYSIELNKFLSKKLLMFEH